MTDSFRPYYNRVIGPIIVGAGDEVSAGAA